MVADSNALRCFSDTTRHWFQEHFSAPTPIQELGWPKVAAGENALLLAPTGSGKTLAAFLFGIDQILSAPQSSFGYKVVYISPLKALAHDVRRNLHTPIEGLCPDENRRISVDLRSGDTSPNERQKMLRKPGDILVTTPESLFLMLGSKARANFQNTHTVIIDEIHVLCPSKRGTHLALSLERLEDLCHRPPQRIGLSATVNPPHEVARFLGGSHQVSIVDASTAPDLDLELIVTAQDMEDGPRPDVAPQNETERRSTELEPKGIWASIYPALIDCIQNHASTLIFVNSRGLCERLAQRLNDISGKNLCQAHHGSVSHAQRRIIEDKLKAGELPAVIATSSMELGIDMEAVDLVIMVESPASVARGLQRAGRAGHLVGQTSVCKFFPKYKGDLLESVVISQGMVLGKIEAITTPKNVLDVLAQQLIAMCEDTETSVEKLWNTVRRSAPYQNLPKQSFLRLLDMLSGHFPSDEFSDLRPRLSWNQKEKTLSLRKGSRMLSQLNAGTIPDRGLYTVHLGEGGARVGELDEEMVFESRAGDIVMLGASAWRIENITHDRVIVSPAPGESGRLPFWHGDGPGRSFELGQAIGEFIREHENLDTTSLIRNLEQKTVANRNAALNLACYLDEQKRASFKLPSDRRIVVESYRDELGDFRVCILSPYGGRIHAPWALAIEAQLSEKTGFEVQTLYSDDGIMLRFADADTPPDIVSYLRMDGVLEGEYLENLLIGQLRHSPRFATCFRENAARALLMPRRNPKRRRPLWQQRLKAKSLMAAVQRHDDFPIVLETYRQILSDVFDLPHLKDILGRIARNEIEIHSVHTQNPSPFARNLSVQYTANFLYEVDTPLAERRAQALSLDRSMLAELVGEAELRELLDEAIIERVHHELQGLAPGYQARDANELHDLLKKLGDLSETEIRLRSEVAPDRWVEKLYRSHRVFWAQINGEKRLLAIENAGVYCTLFKLNPPAHCPARYLSPPKNPPAALLQKFAWHRSPFILNDFEVRYGISPDTVASASQALLEQGILLRGAFLPGGVNVEFCAREVFAQIKRRTLHKLRKAVEAVDAAQFSSAQFQWHGIPKRYGPDSILEALLPLYGYELSWDLLTQHFLPARVQNFQPKQLEALCATGHFVWVPTPSKNKSPPKFRLFPRSEAHLYLEPVLDVELSDDEHTIFDLLKKRGASFSNELFAHFSKPSPGVFEKALESLLRRALITNDTMLPLQPKPSPKIRRRRVSSSAQPGRWWRVDSLLQDSVSPTEASHAWTRLALERYAIFSRTSATSEKIPGGFSRCYPILKSMEEAGKIRRGYFVNNVSGAHFCYPTAIDNLRKNQKTGVTILHAQDPANLFGATLPWPKLHHDHQPKRHAHAFVLFFNGEPHFLLEPKAGRMSRFVQKQDSEPSLDTLRNAFSTWIQGLPKKMLVIKLLNGNAAHLSPQQEYLEDLGFSAQPKGMIYTV